MTSAHYEITVWRSGRWWKPWSGEVVYGVSSARGNGWTRARTVNRAIRAANWYIDRNLDDGQSPTISISERR